MTFDLFFFGLNLSTTVDRNRFIATKALDGFDVNDEHIKKEYNFEHGDAFKKFKSFSNINSENMCIRTTDNFLCYLSDTIQHCMIKRPELLRSSEEIKVEDVLRFSNHKNLVSFLVDRKINELSYGGINGVIKFINSRTGIQLVNSDEEKLFLNFSIELRNIYTHNRGIVNDIFIRRLGDIPGKFKYERGKRFHADFDTIAELANNLYTIASRLDENVSEKFKFKRKKYKTWHDLENKNDD
ncbi:hypothetical protein [Shumkonia mesophila]|uniref:hypothetical protein n=1 Tax=Shumkonia mesophila TaxID=2838854 RepID=UPI0029348785|nr:hypothetical protein [Shumkonia mesophila]